MLPIDSSLSPEVNDGSDLETHISAAVVAIERALVSAGLPGVLIGITDRIRLRHVIVHGYADLKAGVPLSESSRLAIGSISKSFTAIALLQLAAEGRVDLHAPITRYLPGLAPSPPFEAITAHHLITHTSGLPNYLVHTSSSRYVIAALRDFVPNYVPGAHWWYSNTGYQLLGYLLEEVEGLTYPAIIRRRILCPLGMSSTSAVIDDAQRSRMTTSYTRWPYGGAYFEAPWFEYAAGDGSLVSTVPDMCAYARLILNRGAGPSGPLLSESAFLTLTTPVLENYAYGLFVRHASGTTSISHGGSIAGFHSLLEMRMENDLGLVILSSSAMDVDLRKWITDTVAAAYAGSHFPIATAQLNTLKYKAQDYAGVYLSASGNENAPSRTLEFTAANEHLSLKEGNDHRPLLRMGRDCFRLTDGDSDQLPFFFGRAGNSIDATVVEVSHGAQWYVTKAFPVEAKISAPSPDYRAYVGHFENQGPEGPVARVFVRNGQLWVSLSEEEKPTVLEPIVDGLFRLGEEAHSPERVQFDTLMDGYALRMTLSGVPLYRKETP